MIPCVLIGCMDVVLVVVVFSSTEFKFDYDWFDFRWFFLTSSADALY